MTSETTFLAAADAVLTAIGSALDAALESSEADVDWSLNDGILEIDCGARGKLIVNRHLPNREIWVAARAGGFHFRAEGGQWLDMRAGADLGTTLGRLLHEQAALTVDLGALPPPPG